MRTIALAILIALSVTACGQVSRMSASVTGYSKVCVDGVEYLQFPSGVTPAYTPEGRVKSCH